MDAPSAVKLDVVAIMMISWSVDDFTNPLAWCKCKFNLCWFGKDRVEHSCFPSLDSCAP